MSVCLSFKLDNMNAEIKDVYFMMTLN